MATKVYGASDDLIEFEGDLRGEVNYIGGGDDDAGCLLVFSDGTVLAVKYGKPGDRAIWDLSALRKGPLFDRIDICESDDGKDYSDVAHFRSGISEAFAAKEWERVR